MAIGNVDVQETEKNYKCHSRLQKLEQYYTLYSVEEKYELSGEDDSIKSLSTDNESNFVPQEPVIRNYSNITTLA